jgi:hypothetical protein
MSQPHSVLNDLTGAKAFIRSMALVAGKREILLSTEATDIVNLTYSIALDKHTYLLQMHKQARRYFREEIRSRVVDFHTTPSRFLIGAKFMAVLCCRAHQRIKTIMPTLGN